MWDILLILDGFDIVLQLYNLTGKHEWSVNFMILCPVCFAKEVINLFYIELLLIAVKKFYGSVKRIFIIMNYSYYSVLISTLSRY